MSYESESEYATSYYRCLDPIENFKIKVILKPVKNPIIPLPHFDLDQTTLVTTFDEETQQEVEEYTFQWQEKVFCKGDLKKLKETLGKKKLVEKYHGKVFSDSNQNKSHSQRLFTYVQVDDFAPCKGEEDIAFARSKITKSSVSSPRIKNIANIPKSRIINYNPPRENKAESDITASKFLQKMFIMIDFDASNTSEMSKEINHGVLCRLSYNSGSKLLEMTPSFSKSHLKPYVVGVSTQDSRNFFYYWLFHASTSISNNSLRKEIGIMAKVLNHQEELKSLLVGTDFFVGESNHLYVTVFGEIVGGSDFEYDHIYVSYHVKLAEGWQCDDPESLSGVTHTSRSNDQGIIHFSHLFELRFSVDLRSFEGPVLSSPEIIFEVSSVDKYTRYRNEGYAYVRVPESPGMREYRLGCWRPTEKTIKSALERFFIGGGPELEDVSYVGLTTGEKVDLVSRFGFETRPSGNLQVKINVLHQSETLRRKVVAQDWRTKGGEERSDANALLSTVNTVLEAFRKARARMLEARKGLEPDTAHVCRQLQNGFSKKLTLKSRKTRPVET